MTILMKTEDIIKKKKYKVLFYSAFCSQEWVPQIVNTRAPYNKLYEKSVTWTRRRLNTLFLWLSLPFGKRCVKFSPGRDPKGKYCQQKARHK